MNRKLLAAAVAALTLAGLGGVGTQARADEPSITVYSNWGAVLGGAHEFLFCNGFVAGDPGATLYIDSCTLAYDGRLELTSNQDAITGPVAETTPATGMHVGGYTTPLACVEAHAVLSSGDVRSVSYCRPPA